MTDKKNKVKVKLDWIFGIRSDFYPNLFLLDQETIVYPASHYIVIYNFKKTLSLSEQQTFIQGSLFSKGFKAIAVSQLDNRYIVTAEEINNNIELSVYSIISFNSLHNYPDKIDNLKCKVENIEINISKVYHMCFSNLEKHPVYFMAIADIGNLVIILWLWNSNKDNKTKKKHESIVFPLYEEFLQSELSEIINYTNNSFFYISFSNSKNTLFCVVSDNFFAYYKIINEKEPILNNYVVFDINNETIFNFNWVFNNCFCVTTNEFIYFYDMNNDNCNLISKLNNNTINNSKINSNNLNNLNEIRNINTLHNTNFVNQIHDNDYFLIAFGSNGLIEIYEKSTKDLRNVNNSNNEDIDLSNSYNNVDLSRDLHSNIKVDKNKNFNKVYSKAIFLENKDLKYEFLSCVYHTTNFYDNKKQSNNLQDKKYISSTSDINEITQSVSSYRVTSYLITTSNNDLINLDIKYSLSNNTYIISYDYLISSFHSSSIEALDTCVNKPYIITGGKDKQIKIWDYVQKKQIISKNFEDYIYSIAYHPGGMSALVSGSEKIKAVNIYYDDIDNTAQMGIAAKKSKEIVFSNGGQFFAFENNNKIEVWDYLNMAPLIIDHQNRTKINSISFKTNDSSIVLGCYDTVYEWPLHDTPIKPNNSKVSNYLSACCIPNSKDEIIASCEDGVIKKYSNLANNVYQSFEFDAVFNNIRVFKKDKFLLGSLYNIERNYLKPNNNNNNKAIDNNKHKSNNKLISINKEKLSILDMNPLNFYKRSCDLYNIDVKVNDNKNDLNLNNNNFIKNNKHSSSSCIRLFCDYNYLSSTNIDTNEPLISSHFGETLRIQINYSENYIFTVGKDCCLNIYSIIDNRSGDSEESSYMYHKMHEKFTDVVLLKKSKLKEMEIERNNLPEKKNEYKSSKKAAYLEEINKLIKEKEDLSTSILTNKKVFQEDIQRKKDDLEYKTIHFSKELEELSNMYNNIYEEEKNKFQLEITERQRLIERKREEFRSENTNFKKRMAENEKKHIELIEEINKNNNEKFTNLQSHEKELIEEIDNLKNLQILDIEAVKKLNNTILSKIEEEIDKFKGGIENLKNHHKQQIKKLKEKKEKQKQDVEVLTKEMTQINEQKQMQINNKKKLEAQKQKKLGDVDNIKIEIKTLEKNIKEKKVWNSNLEKCKYVLDYQIKELKKETGPLDKTIEELKKHTKGLERVRLTLCIYIYILYDINV